MLVTSILEDIDHRLAAGSVVLDFGCGDGRFVYECRRAGFEAHGVDLVLAKSGEFLYEIPADCYRFPFDDGTFDLVFSNSVMEHVEDMGQALREMHRVLKPGGVGLHIFPAKWRPIEPHVCVPLGTMIRRSGWLTWWAWLGVRGPYQKGMHFRRAAERTERYLREHTFYRSAAELRAEANAYFPTVTFLERLLIRHSYGRAQYLFPVVRLFPFVARLYSGCHNRCMFFRKA